MCLTTKEMTTGGNAHSIRPMSSLSKRVLSQGPRGARYGRSCWAGEGHRKRCKRTMFIGQCL